MKGLDCVFGHNVECEVDLSKNSRERIVNQFRLFNSPNSTTSAQKVVKNNSRRFHKAIRKVQEVIFPDEVPNKTFRVSVGADSRQQQQHHLVEEVEYVVVYDDDEDVPEEEEEAIFIVDEGFSCSDRKSTQRDLSDGYSQDANDRQNRNNKTGNRIRIRAQLIQAVVTLPRRKRRPL